MAGVYRNKSGRGLVVGSACLHQFLMNLANIVVVVLGAAIPIAAMPSCEFRVSCSTRSAANSFWTRFCSSRSIDNRTLSPPFPRAMHSPQYCGHGVAICSDNPHPRHGGNSDLIR